MDHREGIKAPTPLGEKIEHFVGIVVVAIFLILLAHLVFGTLAPALPPADPGYHGYELETPMPVEGP